MYPGVYPGVLDIVNACLSVSVKQSAYQSVS